MRKKAHTDLLLAHLQVTAFNGAGLRTSVNGIPIRVRKDK
jgi:hypothetical protein